MSLHAIEYKAPHILKAKGVISIARKATRKQYQPYSPIITCHIWAMSVCALESIEFLVEAAWLLNTSHLICRLPVTMKIPLTSLRPRAKLFYLLLSGLETAGTGTLQQSISTLWSRSKKIPLPSETESKNEESPRRLPSRQRRRLQLATEGPPGRWLRQRPMTGTYLI